VTGEEVSHEELGGTLAHSTKSGLCHFPAADEEEALREVRRLLSFLPSNNMEDPPLYQNEDDPRRSVDDLLSIVPDDPAKPYDVRDIIIRIVDDGDFMEVQSVYAQNVVVGFTRMGGQSVGIVANNPMAMAGVLDVDASRKAARFVRFCDCFNIPLLTFVDVPGYLPGATQEYGGIILHGAKLIYAYAEATVPKVSVVVRKAYGGAYIVMSSKHLRGDINFAWPGGELAVMGPEGAVNIVFRRQIEAADDQNSTRQEMIAEYREKFANPFIAATRGFIDDVIEPKETRSKIIAALEMLRNKTDSNPQKKHGNIPL
jgi:propionyl-CoA carboxylase beta chain